MSEKSRRSYDSSGRREASARSQAAVVAAASTLMLERGYAATTIGDVAERAGVSTAFVYSSFGSKPGLLKRVVDAAIAGDDEPRSIGERPEVQAIQAARSARRRCDLMAALVMQIQARTAVLVPLMVDAAASDPEIADSLVKQDAGRRQGMAAFVSLLHTATQLRPGLTADEATDIAWVLTDVAAYRRLVESRSWTREAYAGWLANALYDGLCRRR
jgi:AcrR family transcriptional regulator